jgi:hypothetical protein
MNAHFFDIDSLIRVESLVWIVSKIRPNVPLIKITQSEFNLIKKGIYRKYNCQLTISGTKYWIPENLMNELKIKCKVNNCDITDIGFSMQEFMNPELISNLKYDIMVDNIYHLKNTSDEIYVICSRNTEENYKPIIKKVESSLQEIGLQIKKFYYISETFYNRSGDDISHKKVRLLLQHLIGYKTDGDKFTDEEVQKYETVYFYDDENVAVELAKNSNTLLHFLLNNSNENLKSLIKQNLKENESLLVVNHATHNKINPFLTKNVKLSYQNLIKTFEGFRTRY